MDARLLNQQSMHPKYANICRFMPANRKKKIRKTKEIRGIKGMIKVLFICHGNICRSTMGQSMMTYMVKQKGLEDLFEIDSAATSREEIGNPPHYGTVSKLRQVGIPLVPHRARQMTRADYEHYDYLIGMDTYNIRNMERIAGGDPEGKIYKLMTFADSGRDVADPWYTGDFEATYRDLKEGLEGFFEYLEKNGDL